MTAPEPGAASFGLALRLARRELRGGLRAFRAFLASLILGIGAIAAVGTLTESLLAGLRSDGRVLLGGDLDLRLVHREITAEQHAWLEARGRLSQVTELRVMAHAEANGDGRRTLAELRAVDDAFARAETCLESVGLGHRLGHYPGQLSGGEQQRTALARAFAAEPGLILADEPTGNLDRETGAQVRELLFDLQAAHGTTLVLITHDPEVATRCQRGLSMVDGRIVEPDAASAAAAGE